MSGNSVKVVILGDSSVGKTSLIQRYINGRNDIQNSTLGAVFIQLHHTLKDKSGEKIKFPIQFWDTAGQERYHSLIPMYLRDSDYIIISFNLFNKATFFNLDVWIRLAKHNIKKCKFILVGCKNDIEFKNSPTDEEINSFINKNIPGSKFFKTSSVTGENVNKFFEFIKKDLEEIAERRINLNSYKINSNIQLTHENTRDNTFYELGGKLKCCF